MSPMSSVLEEQQPTSQQTESSTMPPLVINLEETCQTSLAVTSASESSTSESQVMDQSTQDLSGIQSNVELVDVADLSAEPETAVTTDLSVTMAADTGTSEVAFDLTVCRPPCSEVDDSVVFVSETPTTSTSALSDEYRTQYEKYEQLCALITIKDRELSELNEERKKLHQQLVDLQRAILSRPTSPPDTYRPPSVTDKDCDKKREESRQDRTAEMSVATTACRRRPAHRGVTSVRVMVKSTQPPTAHSTKINLLRYNSLFCNYDDAAVARRKPSTEVVVTAENPVSNVLATDLSAQPTTTKHALSSDDVSAQLTASTDAPEEPYLTKDVTAAPFVHASGENRSNDVDGEYVNSARPTSHGRLEPVQHQQRHPFDDCQTSSVADLCFSAATQNMAPVSHAVRPPGAYIVPDDGQRAARQIADAARHQQFVVATTNEMIMSTAGASRRDVDDQRAIVLRPEMSLMMSPRKRRFSGADVELPVRPLAERRELRPPPPYPHRGLENPHAYSVTAAPPPQLSPSVRMSRNQSDNSTVAVSYIYRKENSAGPRTGYVQPMRVENQAVTALPLSSVCTVREEDANRQPFCDISPRAHPAGEAVFFGNRMSPPTIPLRVGAVRAANDQLYYHLQHVTSDMPQPQPRNNGSYHGNRLSNSQSLRSDAVRHALLAPSVEQRHVIMTSSSERNDVTRYPVEPRPLDQLQHFVGGPVQMQQQPVDVGKARVLRRSSPPSPSMMTSLDARMHAAEYTRHDAAPVAGQVRDCHVITDAELARRAACYQAAGHSPRYPTAPPPPPALRHDPNPSQLYHPPRPGPPHAAPPTAAPLDMSGAKHRRYAPVNQVTLKTVVNNGVDHLCLIPLITTTPQRIWYFYRTLIAVLTHCKKNEKYMFKT